MNLDLTISRRGRSPIFAQLRDQLRYFILIGQLEPGRRLPSVRELAGFLRIDVNTVVKAYRALEAEGYIISRQGQGTFVAEGPAPEAPARRDEFRRLVAEATHRASALGYSPQQFASAVLGYGSFRSGSGCAREGDLVFVECNLPDIDFYRTELSRGLGREVRGILLADLKETGSGALEFCRRARMVLTTFFHVKEVTRLVGLGASVLAILSTPQFSSLTRIGQVPAGTRVGLICATAEGVGLMEKSITDAGFGGLISSRASLEDPEAVRGTVRAIDLAVVSTAAMIAARVFIPAGLPVIEFADRVDPATVEMVRGMIGDE